MVKIMWNALLHHIAETDRHIDRFELTEDGEILCKTKEDADCLSDFLECVFDEIVCTAEYTEGPGYEQGFRWEIHLNGM